MFKSNYSLLVLMLLVSSGTQAAECDLTLESTSNMTFSKKSIEISKKCKEVTITLKNTSTFAKAMMGHNLVIAKASDMEGVLEDGSAAGLATDYVKNKDPRVVVHTKVLGPNESETIKLPITKLAATEGYMFFCSFPGHASMMKGEIKFL